jgi:hypothetical protein
MAKATSSVKRVEIQGDIVLTLTPLEAIVLRAVVGRTVGSGTAAKAAGNIYDALSNAGVSRTQGNISNHQLSFVDLSDDLVQDALTNW